MDQEKVDKSPGLSAQELKQLENITRAWARDRVAILKGNVSALGLVKTGTLQRSIRGGVRLSYGEVSTIWFKYQYWGLFHDKGAQNVGRGKITLPAQHWMARFIYGPQLDELLDKLSDFYVDVTLNTIKLDDVKAK